MKILIVEPGKYPRQAEIKGGLKEMQEIVGGTIQAVYPWEEPVALVCNDEGKLDNLPLNRSLEDYDIISGTFFLCGISEDNFSGLNDRLLKKYEEKFKYPELILETPLGIMMERCTPEAYAQYQEWMNRQPAPPSEKEPER